MRRSFLAFCVLILSATSLRAEETVVHTTIDSVGLFKNGLAVVERSVELAGPGTYRIEDVPTPVHGTFFIESTTPVATRATTMLVDSPLDVIDGPLQDQLAGKEAAITLREQPNPILGTVAAIEPGDKSKQWNRGYQGSSSMYDGWGRAISVAPAAGRFLVLETKDGRVLVDQAAITSLKITGDAKTAKRRKPVLMLTLAEGAPKQTVHLSYLAKGLAWAPSYRVDLVDDKKLAIKQNAVVKNELMDLKGVEVFLISGYPSIDFAHVTSPLALQQTWTAFFTQLSSPPSADRYGNRAAMQQQVLMNSISNGEGASGMAAPPDESIDVHYESIGKQTLEDGDALALDVGAAQADYER